MEYNDDIPSKYPSVVKKFQEQSKRHPLNKGNHVQSRMVTVIAIVIFSRKSSLLISPINPKKTRLV